MWISDTSVRRPILAIVLNLLLIAFGIVAIFQLSVREYPDIDPPVVSIQTAYPGAAANVVENRITEIIEDRISGIEGVRSITSESLDGQSRITLEFEVGQDVDDAANDVRDRVSGSLDDLPDEADPPDIQKTSADDEVIIWLNFEGRDMTIMELTEYAQRFLEDRFSSLTGIARVRIGGAQEKSLRVWLDPDRLTALGLTAEDVQVALESENVELPAGSIQSKNRDFTVRMKRTYITPEDFKQLPIKTIAENQVIRLGDVGRVEIGAIERRSTLRGNGLPIVGIGIIKQSTANTLDVAQQVRDEVKKINEMLPEYMAIKESFDSSVFIANAMKEVVLTLFIGIILVMMVMYAFLGDLRATLIPAVTVPVSLIATFIILYAFGFTINVLTLLALVLAIGLVVDDAIVVLENIRRRVDLGEPPLLAAYRGTRQVGFAVVATTFVLVAVFVPIVFLEGDLGRLFSEFSATLIASVVFSAVAALTVCPVLASFWVKPKSDIKISKLNKIINTIVIWSQNKYRKILESLLNKPFIIWLMLILFIGLMIGLGRSLPVEYAPKEDRGSFTISIRGPTGVSYDYILEHVNEVEKRLKPFVDSGEFQRLLMRAPGSFGETAAFDNARATVVLSSWNSGRKPISYYTQKVRELTADIPGVSISAIERQPLRGGERKPVQFVLGGPTFEELAEWRDIVLKRAAENPNLIAVDHNFYDNKPLLEVEVLRDQAARLNVTVSAINRTLETLLGSRRVSRFIEDGEQYDVILESEKSKKTTLSDIERIYVRSEFNQLIPLSSLIKIGEYADSSTLNRYNRVRSITIEANLAEGYSIGEALDYLENIVRTDLPSSASIDYQGASRDFKESNQSIIMIFGLALFVVFLVLAGQFESWIHPFIILLTVPLAMSGAFLGLWFHDATLNIYSQIGLVILIGLSTKNGILIVEFINQLRDEGVEFKEAILDASIKRLRPIVMTGMTTAVGAIPLVISHGAGAETRQVIGIVILWGVTIATFMTLLIVPIIYANLARNTKSPQQRTKELERLEDLHPKAEL